MDNIVPQTPMLIEYKTLCKKKNFLPHPAQEKVLHALDQLKNELIFHTHQPCWKQWLKLTKTPQGIYIYGDVGRGKTMLMDVFYRVFPSTRKHRAHFHVFMQQIHKDLKTQHLLKIAQTWKRNVDLLCFDEFHITNIADAMILSRLFQCFWQQGIVIVATSNFKPEELYPHGLHRERLQPFFQAIHHHMKVLHLDIDIDYRRLASSDQTRYFYPLNDLTHRRIQSLYEHLTQQQENTPYPILVGSRALLIERSGAQVCAFTFAQLCEVPLGREDYLTLAQTFSTLILENVPSLTHQNSDAAQRFATLIDILYDENVQLIISAAAPPEALYESIPSPRTISRLIEMTGWKVPPQEEKKL